MQALEKLEKEITNTISFVKHASFYDTSLIITRISEDRFTQVFQIIHLKCT